MDQVPGEKLFWDCFQYQCKNLLKAWSKPTDCLQSDTGCGTGL